eukprot:scaffold84698_cov44-Phaeocystis_antarctica.AAC.1
MAPEVLQTSDEAVKIRYDAPNYLVPSNHPFLAFTSGYPVTTPPSGTTRRATSTPSASSSGSSRTG